MLLCKFTLDRSYSSDVRTTKLKTNQNIWPQLAFLSSQSLEARLFSHHDLGYADLHCVSILPRLTASTHYLYMCTYVDSRTRVDSVKAESYVSLWFCETDWSRCGPSWSFWVLVYRVVVAQLIMPAIKYLNRLESRTQHTGPKAEEERTLQSAIKVLWQNLAPTHRPDCWCL